MKKILRLKSRLAEDFANFSKKSLSHLEILGAKRVPWSKLHNEGAQV